MDAEGARSYTYGGEKFQLSKHAVETITKYNEELRDRSEDVRFIVGLIISLHSANKLLLPDCSVSKNLFEFIGRLFKIRVNSDNARMATFASMFTNGINIAKELVRRRVVNKNV